MALHHRVIAASTSGQSHLIVAAVLLSFIVWITLQRHLHVYLNALGLGVSSATQAASGAAPGNSVGGGIGGAIGKLPSLIPPPPVQTPPFVPPQ